MSHLTLVHSSTSIAAAPHRHHFTSRDLLDLQSWMARADAHNYRRLLIEPGSDGLEPADGGYVLLYAPGREWASWGLARSGAHVAVWHCGTGADLGRYPGMLQALETLPPARPAPRTSGRPATSTPTLRSNLVRLEHARRDHAGAPK